MLWLTRTDVSAFPQGRIPYPPGRFAAARGARAHIECAPTVRQIRKAGIMKNTKTKRMLAVAALLAVGLALMLYYAAHQAGLPCGRAVHL